MALPLYGVTNMMGVTFDEEDEDKLLRWVASIGHSKSRLSASPRMHRGYATSMKVRGAKAG